MTFAETQNDVTISISGLRSGKGSVAISIFSLEQRSSFPGKAENATKTFYLDLNGQQSLSVKAENLPSGEYAIALMHDENGNHQMDTRLFGIPKEGFGFSNNPKVFFGPPSFQKCAFKLEGTPIEIPVTMKYLL